MAVTCLNPLDHFWPIVTGLLETRVRTRPDQAIQALLGNLILKAVLASRRHSEGLDLRQFLGRLIANMAVNQLESFLANEPSMRHVFGEIEAIAAAKLAQEFNSSLSTGDLVNEAVMRLTRLDRIEFQSRNHIFALASRMMRQILIDEARRRNADKRYHTKVTLATDLPDDGAPVDLLELGLVLEALRDIDEQRADIVEMRYFGGMSLAEIAAVLDLSESTVKRRWTAARIWMRERLSK